MSPVYIKIGAKGFELTKTDLRGPRYNIIRKNRPKNHKTGNFVLGHWTSVSSQGLQRQVVNLVLDTHRAQEAKMQEFNWSKPRSGGQKMRF